MSWRTCPDCGVQWDPSMGPNAWHECPVAQGKRVEDESRTALLRRAVRALERIAHAMDKGRAS